MALTTGEVSWSAEHFRIFGLDPDATTPSYEVFRDRIHPEDRAAFEEMLEKAVRDGSNFQYGFRIVTPDGATKIFAQPGVSNRQRRQRTPNLSARSWTLPSAGSERKPCGARWLISNGRRG